MEPATEKQKSYMNSLGISYSETITKKDASSLIDSFLIANPLYQLYKSDRALLEYMGVTPNTLEEAQNLIEYYNNLEHIEIGLFKLLSYFFTGRLLEYKKLKSEKYKLAIWNREKHLLYPIIFVDELMCIASDVFRNYVRRKYIGCSERLTNDKIKNTIIKISTDNPHWLLQNNYLEIFVKGLQELYPHCCDGRHKIQ